MRLVGRHQLVHPLAVRARGLHHRPRRGRASRRPSSGWATGASPTGSRAREINFLDLRVYRMWWQGGTWPLGLCPPWRSSARCSAPWAASSRCAATSRRDAERPGRRPTGSPPPPAERVVTAMTTTRRSQHPIAPSPSSRRSARVLGLAVAGAVAGARAPRRASCSRSSSTRASKIDAAKKQKATLDDQIADARRQAHGHRRRAGRPRRPDRRGRRRSSPSRARSSRCCSEQLRLKRLELRRPQEQSSRSSRTNFEAARRDRLQDRRPHLRRRRARVHELRGPRQPHERRAATSSAATTTWSASSRRRATRWTREKRAIAEKEDAVARRRSTTCRRRATSWPPCAPPRRRRRRPRWRCASRRTARSRRSTSDLAAARAPGEPAARREPARSPASSTASRAAAAAPGSMMLAGQRAGHVALRLAHPPDPRLPQVPHRHRHRRGLRHAHPRRRQRHRHLRHLDGRLRQRDHHRPRRRHLDALRAPVVAGRGHRRARSRAARSSATWAPRASPRARTCTSRCASTAIPSTPWATSDRRPSLTPTPPLPSS